MSKTIKPIKTRALTQQLLFQLLVLEWNNGDIKKTSKRDAVRQRRLIATILTRCSEPFDDNIINNIIWQGARNAIQS